MAASTLAERWGFLWGASVSAEAADDGKVGEIQLLHLNNCLYSPEIIKVMAQLLQVIRIL